MSAVDGRADLERSRLEVGLSPISDIAQLFHISAAKPVSAPTKVLI
jgi:hypothetical protein